MKIEYYLSEDMPEEEYLCETCGTTFDDFATLDTEERTVNLEIAGCYGSNKETLSLDDFLDYYGNDTWWDTEPYHNLIEDVLSLTTDKENK